MTIVGYEEQNELTETIPARQLLATNPILLEIYNYQNDVTLETRVEKRINKVEYMPRRMQMMIIDYFEVNHSGVGMQLIENMLSTGKRPPSALLIALINTMLQSKDGFKSRETQRNHWSQCKQAYTLLMDVLTLFGPEMFNPVWNEFAYFKLSSSQSMDMDDESGQYELLNTKELSAYSGFWNYVDKVLNQPSHHLEARCRALVLAFFVNVLQTDLKERLGDDRKVARSIFFATLTNESLFTCTKFDKYLDIVLKGYPNENEHLCQLSGDLLNMMITISCFDKISSFDGLVSQLYSRFQQMDPEACSQLMQAIKYPTFLIALLDKAVADTDVSRIESSYKKFRNKKHVPLRLEKVLFYVLKTEPNTISPEALYRHALIVSKYCMCVLSTASIVHKRPTLCEQVTNTALEEDQLILLIENHHQALDEWEARMEHCLAQFKTIDLKLVEKIRWSVKLTRLTMAEYL
ncbi:hypothetical protein G6F46_012602 [Rhizopus delemar]|nr:hypothetical protein G6F55_012442 [Rhizopus delemar]KAG1541054.1 hypothetical protein G6F51_008143 [Rhizopus arrhizus]KAG1492132.1 hypothetical protein G6F54_009527 [Rhizopus delemar]KAG1509609.1 hypothetical protein G6F53_007312 [Rhizopus delemar]KAG1521670.1 hypothetical protein G6F52_006535 [Rhizopus delemar]